MGLHGSAMPPPSGMPPPVPPPPAIPPLVAPTQVPDWQVSVPLQAMQALPELPHLLELGTWMQVVPSQHPLQFAGPQVVAVTQLPLKQLWFEPHCWHTPPSPPQARFEFPGVHAPASERHPGQAKVTHWPEVLQALFCAWQFWHTAPPVPQAVKVLPPRQAPFSQQPLQFAQAAMPPAAPPPAEPPAFTPPPAAPPAVPAPAPQSPALQPSPAMQMEQVRPSVPQAPGAVPGWQSLFASQQPLQFERRQRFCVGPHEGTAAKVMPKASPRRNARPFMGDAR